jgi:hypothetical protein
MLYGDPGRSRRRNAASRALTEFADRYADQNERDYEVFMDQIRSGRLEVAEES